jgi:hypothetical protein
MSEDEQDELSAAMKNPYRYYRYYFREHCCVGLVIL